MKKFLTFMAFALMSVCALTLASCSDDDDNDGPTNNAIVGTWEMVEHNFSEWSSMAEYSKYAQFQKGGKYIEIYEDGDVNRGTWTLSGDKLHMVEETLKIPVEYTIKFDGNDSFEATGLGFSFKFKRVDDSVIEPYLKETSAGQIKVNGKVWELSKSESNSPKYRCTNGFEWGNIELRFCKKENDFLKEMFPDEVELELSTRYWSNSPKGWHSNPIVKGMDLAKFAHEENPSDCSLSEGEFGDDNYSASIYNGSKPISGSAIVVDLKENDFITIRFSDFKLPRTDDEVYGSNKPQPETLTLDGTVTFKYTESITWN